MTASVFADAIVAAERSTIRRHRTGAAIYAKDGTLLSNGWSHVPAEHYTETPFSMHAEHHALSRLRVCDYGRAHTIVIATLTKGGNVTCGEPCPACARKLNGTPIQEVIATQRINV